MKITSLVIRHILSTCKTSILTTLPTAALFFTYNVTHAAAIATSKDELAATAQGADSKYTLTENTSGAAAAGSIDTVTKLIANADGTYTTVDYDITLDKVMGDADTTGKTAVYLKWATGNGETGALGSGVTTEFGDQKWLSADGASADDHDVMVWVDASSNQNEKISVNYMTPSIIDGSKAGFTVNHGSTTTHKPSGLEIDGYNSSTLFNISGDYVGIVNQSNNGSYDDSNIFGITSTMELNDIKIDSLKTNFIGNISMNGSGVYTDNATITTIAGDFLYNSSVGPALLRLDSSTITSITSDIIGNKQLSATTDASSPSAAIVYLRNTTISTMSSDILNNESYGALIYLDTKLDTSVPGWEDSVIETFTGDVTGNKINTSSSASVSDRAIFKFYNLESTVTAGVTNFSGNVYNNQTSHIFQLGSNTHLGILAKDNDVLLENANREVISSRAAKDKAYITLNAVNGKKITMIGDMGGMGLASADPEDRQQTIYINNGLDGQGNAITGITEYSTVEHSGDIDILNLIIENGEFYFKKDAVIPASGATAPIGTIQAASIKTEAAATFRLADGGQIDDYNTFDVSGDMVIESGHLGISYRSIALGETINDAASVALNLQNGGHLELQNDADITLTSRLNPDGSGNVWYVTNTITSSGQDNTIKGQGAGNVVNAYFQGQANSSLDITTVGLSAKSIVDLKDGAANAASTTASIDLINSTVVDIEFDGTNHVETFGTHAGTTVFDMLNVGDELTKVVVEGSLTYDLNMADSLYYELAKYDEVGIRMAEGDGELYTKNELGEIVQITDFVDLDLVDVYIQVNDQTFQATDFYLDETGNSVFIISVPEPSTATLSLLALAGLLARRRRRV